MDELSIIQPPETIKLTEIPPYDIQDYDVFDEKDFRKYINDVKKTARKSLEYSMLMQYLKNNFNMKESSFFENVNNIDTNKIKIEIHHSPYTLEDICTTVFNKRVFYGEDIDVEDVAKEVMYVHYFLIVGLISLSQTEHELVHNQYLFIPTDKVLGNYKEFEEIYGPWIPEETKDKIKAIEEQTRIYNEEANKAILQQRQIPIELHDNTGLYQLPTMETMESLMNKRIEQIRYQNSHAIVDNSYDNNVIDAEEVLTRGVSYDLIPGITYDE